MGFERLHGHGSCITVRSLSPPPPPLTTSSLSVAYNHSSESHSVDSSGCTNDVTCGNPIWIGKGLTCYCFKRKGSYQRICFNLTPQQLLKGVVKSFELLNEVSTQLSIIRACDELPLNLGEERVRRLKDRRKIYFDPSRQDHQEALRSLWSAAYSEQELHSLISEQWKEMGWQGKDPSTDFRGAGFISLENLLFFAKTFPRSFQHLLKKEGGKRATWEYPFAVAGVNITFMIIQMLDLDSAKRRAFVRAVFFQMLSENEWAFDLLYCVAFVVMDKQWLEKNATYMEFNDVLKCTRAQLEKELLMDDVMRIEDMPSYSLLLASSGEASTKQKKFEGPQVRMLTSSLG